jgi:geranylgeranyl pyrophosphate synthase
MKKNAIDESFDIDEYFQSYISKTYYKTASMISIGCRYLSNDVLSF